MTATVVPFPSHAIRPQFLNDRRRCELCQHCRAEFSTWTNMPKLYCDVDIRRAVAVERNYCCGRFEWTKVVS